MPRILICHVRGWHIERRWPVVTLVLLFLLQLGIGLSVHLRGVSGAIPFNRAMFGAFLVPACESAGEAFTFDKDSVPCTRRPTVRENAHPLRPS
jgi:hypothetical protein